MTLQIAGEKTHFTIRYDDAVGAPALAVANMVLGLCEADLNRLSTYLPYQRGGGGDPFLHPKIDIQIINDPVPTPDDPTGGPPFASADESGGALGPRRIRINPFSAPGVTITNDYAGFLFVAEMAELIMVAFYDMDPGSSQGEALSRVMAEELHPASAGNWVNDWLSSPRPRPDWISRNAPADGGIAGRGDLNQMAYGCGVIFIYFLRYQLGFSYDQLGGGLLSEQYQRLTHAGDDPADRVSKLLDAHFGTGRINLVGNNPFPLYEGTDRRVFLAFAKPDSRSRLLPESGSAHVQPYFNCPAADYPYSVYGTYVTQTITATTLGIGLPTFRWRINGKLLSNSTTWLADTVTTQVDVPDPQHPGHPTPQTQTFAFHYQIHDPFTAPGGSSTLTLTSQSQHGDYHVEVQVEADETARPTGPVKATSGLTLTTRTITYGGTYDADQERCAKAFEKETAGRVRVQQSLNLLHTLPDPPPPDYLANVLEATAQIQQELARLAATDHAAASQIAQYVAGQLGVPARVFLAGAGAGE